VLPERQDVRNEVINHTNANDTPETIVVCQVSDVDGNTTTSDLASTTSSRQQKTGESMLLADWVRKGLFKYCKFVTSNDELDYGEPLSLFVLDENNINNEKQKWWNSKKKFVVQTLNEKRGCVAEAIKIIFKSKCISNVQSDLNNVVVVSNACYCCTEQYLKQIEKYGVENVCISSGCNTTPVNGETIGDTWANHTDMLNAKMPSWNDMRQLQENVHAWCYLNFIFCLQLLAGVCGLHQFKGVQN